MFKPHRVFVFYSSEDCNIHCYSIHQQQHIVVVKLMIVLLEMMNMTSHVLLPLLAASVAIEVDY